MISRRTFLSGAAAALLLPPCHASAAHYPLDASAFPELWDQADRPWLGLATSLAAEHDYAAHVEGQLPAALRGTLYRNGPGLFERGGQRKQCLIDGDGMIQSFRFGANGVRYRNRFTRTQKFVDEQRRGRYHAATWTTQAPGGAFANLFGSAIESQAGVSAVVKNGRLYAFDESGRRGIGGEPYEIDLETLDTLNVANLGATDEPGYYAAHSKTDGRNGEWLHFGLEYGRKLVVHLTVFRKDASVASHRAVTLPRYCYIHDWFVTQNHIVLNLHPAEISLFPFLLGRSSLAGALRWKPERGNQLLIVPRQGNAKPVVVETEAAWMWHALNAFEREGRIIADFVGYDDPNHFLGDDAWLWTIMSGRQGKNAPGSLRRYVIDPQRTTVRSETIADDANYEFPIVNPQHACHEHRHGYLVRNRSKGLFWREVVRIDTETGRTESYDFGEHQYVTEPLFVPASDGGGRDAGREAGWLMTEGYDGQRQRGFLAVLRADRIADGPVAVIHLRHHVPLSLHGWWHADS